MTNFDNFDLQKFFDNMDLKKLDEHIVAAHNAREKKKEELKEKNKLKLENYAKTLGTTVEEVYDLGGVAKKARKSKARPVLYINDQGKPFKRAKPEWSPEQKEKYEENAQESAG